MSDFLPTEVREQLARIDEALAVLAAERRMAAPILTAAEAIAYTKHESASAFSRWATRYGVLNASNGRWPRHRLDAGMLKESRMGGVRRARLPVPLEAAA